MIVNLAASIRQKLLNHAKAQKEDFSYVLKLYAIQRLLYRLSLSPYVDKFLLKGSWMFLVWNQFLHRATKDVDLLGIGENNEENLIKIFEEIFLIESEDGIQFLPESITAFLINREDKYHGIRLKMSATLDQAKIPIQIDVGHGDAVVPEPAIETLPSLLSLPCPALRVYPVYSVVSEKFEAMVDLDIDNTRIKDFHDIWVIASSMTLQSKWMAKAIVATFQRRKTAIEKTPLFIFSDEFRNNTNKQIQWKAFINKNKLDYPFPFSDLIVKLAEFIEPIYFNCHSPNPDELQWNSSKWAWE